MARPAALLPQFEPVSTFVTALHNASYVGHMVELHGMLLPLRAAEPHHGGLLPPVSNVSFADLAPYTALGLTCEWGQIGTRVDIALPSDRLYELYGRLLCVPVVTADEVLHMLSLQVQPYTATLLSVRTASRWLPDGFLVASWWLPDGFHGFLMAS